MSAANRSSSAKTNKEQAKVDWKRIEQLKHRAFVDGPWEEADGRRWVETVKDRRPAPTVLDERGNASAVRRRTRQYQLKKACMTSWKAVAQYRAALRRVFTRWAIGIVLATRTVLTLTGEFSDEAEASSMEEVD